MNRKAKAAQAARYRRDARQWGYPDLALERQADQLLSSAEHYSLTTDSTLKKDESRPRSVSLTSLPHDIPAPVALQDPAASFLQEKEVSESAKRQRACRARRRSRNGWHAVYIAEMTRKALPENLLEDEVLLDQAIDTMQRKGWTISASGLDQDGDQLYTITSATDQYRLRADQIVTMAELGVVRTHYYGLIYL